MGISGSEILLILLVVLLLFGSEKMPGIARGLAKGFGEIKRASDDIKREILEGSSGIMEQVNEIKSDFDNHASLIRGEIDDLNTSIKTGTATVANDLNNSINGEIESVPYQIPDVRREINEIRERLFVNEDVAEIKRILYEDNNQQLSGADDSYLKFYQHTEISNN